VPEEWEVIELGVYAFVTKLAGFEYTKHINYSIGGDIIALRALNLKGGELDLNDIQTIPKGVSEYLKRSKLSKGDLVISYVGTVGEMAVIEEDDKYHLAPNVAKITVKRNKLNPWFLKEYLFSHEGKTEIMNQTASTTQAAMSMGNIRKLKIKMPKIEEQESIVKKLDQVHNKIKDEINYLHKLNSIKTGLMQDLLSGRVRVPEEMIQ
jgi:type I restriction enzyme S subunit